VYLINSYHIGFTMDEFTSSLTGYEKSVVHMMQSPFTPLRTILRISEDFFRIIPEHEVGESKPWIKLMRTIMLINPRSEDARKDFRHARTEQYYPIASYLQSTSTKIIMMACTHLMFYKALIMCKIEPRFILTRHPEDWTDNIHDALASGFGLDPAQEEVNRAIACVEEISPIPKHLLDEITE